MRLVLIVASLGLLGGCNVLMTQNPLLTGADAAGAPPMRPGVWAEELKPDCQADLSQPLASWPSCADGFVVLPGGKVGTFQQQDGKPAWVTSDLVMAAGDPLLLQARMEANIGGGVQPAAYIYAGARPTRFDDQGRVVELTTWPVLCGPPAPADAKNPDGTQRYGTLQPADGLTMDPQGNDCTTTSGDAARAAAKASEAWNTPTGLSHDHWVREGDH
jgi:hypothetical protein